MQGYVRTFVYCRASATLLLGVKGNRWCGAVGRAHRSNGVYYVANLADGTWHQRCVIRFFDNPLCTSILATLLCGGCLFITVCVVLHHHGTSGG